MSSPGILKHESRAGGHGRLLIIALTLYAAFVALAGWSFWNRDLWSDEVVSLMLIGGHDTAAVTPGTYDADGLAALYDPAPGPSVGDVWRWAAERDNHPPGYSALFAAIVGVTGDIGPTGVRLANIALTGLFIFPLLLLMSALGWRPAWATAAVTALSPYAFYAAREIRPYGIMLLLTTLSAWLTLRALRSEGARWPWLLALLAVNVAGCTQHKLFVGVVAAQVVLLGLVAMKRGDMRRIAEVAILAVLSAAAAWLIPNVLLTSPTIGAFETAWLQKPREPLLILNALLVYVAYYAAWWIAPPDDMMNTIYGYAFFAAFIGLLLWLCFLMGRLLVAARWPGPQLLFVLPVAMMLGLYLVTGNDFSQAARYSVIWAPLAAAWLVAGLRPGRETRIFTIYAAVSLAVGSTLVLNGMSHRNPDRTREVATSLVPSAPRLLWPMDTTLNTRALLLALQSELVVAGKAPAQFEVIPRELLLASARPGDSIVGPRRYAPRFRRSCEGQKVAELGAYFACTVARPAPLKGG